MPEQTTIEAGMRVRWTTEDREYTGTVDRVFSFGSYTVNGDDGLYYGLDVEDEGVEVLDA
jgi:hypothetical protein